MERSVATRSTRTRWALAVVLGIVALNAVGGALYGLSGAQDVPRSWLDGSPFDSYVVPSLILGAVVGGTHLTAFVLVTKSHRYAREASLLAAMTLAVWIVAQVALIGYVSFLQPLMFAVAALTAALASSLPTSRRENAA
jgi:ABC-type uncharacterized transport system permease subunit